MKVLFLYENEPSRCFFNKLTRGQAVNVIFAYEMLGFFFNLFIMTVLKILNENSLEYYDPQELSFTIQNFTKNSNSSDSTSSALTSSAYTPHIFMRNRLLHIALISVPSLLTHFTYLPALVTFILMKVSESKLESRRQAYRVRILGLLIKAFAPLLPITVGILALR